MLMLCMSTVNRACVAAANLYVEASFFVDTARIGLNQIEGVQLCDRYLGLLLLTIA